MKKFALGILSVFMILGGVLLSACDKKVSLSVSETEVVLYTNYDQGVNRQKEIEVELDNSNAGVNVEIIYGQDCIELDRSNTTTQKSNGKYAFRILTKAEKNSGYAQIKVSAIEDSSQFEYVDVTVNTVLEDLPYATEDSEDGRSNLFAVKGVRKELVTTDYFDFEPATANICDIDWTFGDLNDDGNLNDSDKQMFVDDELVAEISGNSLLVYDGYTYDNVNVVATYKLNSNINRTLTLEVLENSTIQNFEVDGNVFYRNGTVQATSATVDLKRNDSNLSSAEGTLTLNVSPENKLRLSAVVYRVVNGQAELVDRSIYEDYFIFDYTESTSGSQGTVKTYNIEIDAIDNSAKNIFGSFEFYLQVDYADYNYAISTFGTEANNTKTTLNLDISYAATSIDLYDADGYSLNNTFQDVFSSYETGLGYQIEGVVGPTDVAVDDRYYRISIDTRQDNLAGVSISSPADISKIANFYTANGQSLTFTRSGSYTYVSNQLETGTSIYVTAGEEVDVLEDIEFRFESPTHNTSAYTLLHLTFYKISDDTTLNVTNEDDSDIDSVTYISSSVYSSRELEFTVKITGISTDSGLTLCDDGTSGFEYSDFTLLESGEENGEGYIVGSFTVNLTSYRFSDTSSFWFEHITGKVSERFDVEAFVPIDSLVVQNNDKSSANVFMDDSTVQNFLLENNAISESADSSNANTSLSRLMIEAGASLPLSTSVQNATLTENGISYRYMSFDQFMRFMAVEEGLSYENDYDALLELANEKFSSEGIDAITNFAGQVTNPYMYFNTLENAPFSISQTMLTLSNSDFKGFVAILAEGYNEEHETITFVRIFAIESFYSVRYLSSNVRTTLLYSADTLSISDMNRSVEDVTLTMRQDDNIPTYVDSLEYFSFESGLQELSAETSSLWKNDYYEISNVTIANGGRNLTFRITAKSTNLQTSVNDILRVVYSDEEHGFYRTAEIQIEIKNEKRLESVQWVNRTADGEIYLNLTSSNASEKNFTISTSVEPSDANDVGLTAVYHAFSGSTNDIKITTSSIGQIFNVNINTDKGGRGYIYLLPNDMVKNVDGVRQILVYNYTTDETGSIKENSLYIPLSDLNERYDEIINGSQDISNYFINNDGERVYYSNISLRIAITIADGNSEGTAIRVYNQADLEAIDTAKYYRVMNDITLSGWQSYTNLSGMIYGNDSNVTLKFTNGSQAFVNNLSGTIKDLTFVGEVTANGGASAGFIANEVGEDGLIESCAIDVYYENIASEYYESRLISYATQRTGAVAGLNYGTIRNVFVYGASINAQSTFVGGIVGENNGLIEGTGFEFYRFKSSERQGEFNTITSSGNVGGIVGFAGGTSVVRTSYVYAYSLPTTNADGTNFDYNYKNIISANGFVGVFAGGSSNGARFIQSFGYIGNVSNVFLSSASNQYVTLENSYVSYFGADEDKVVSDIYKNVTYSFVNSSEQYINGTASNKITLDGSDTDEDKINGLGLDSTIWNLEKTDSDINFGYIYLRTVSQSTAVNIDEIGIQDLTSENDGRYRVLSAGDKTVGDVTYETGVLFMYNPTSTIVDASEKAMLDNLNTISLAELFGVTEQQARSLLLTTDSSLVSITSNSIRLLSTSINEFDISVHSKMDFTQIKTFKFIILNMMPQLSTVLDGVPIQDEQVVLLQRNQSRTISYNTTSSLYLNGTTAYALQTDGYTIDFEYVGDSTAKDYVTVTRSGNKIVLLGLQKHLYDDRTTIYTNLEHNTLSAKEGYENYAEAVNSKISRTFDVRVYEGAESLDIVNANNLIISPSEYASFDVQLKTDEESDNLVFTLQYGEVEIRGTGSDNSYRFDVDSNLSLDVSWAKVSSVGNEHRYRVLVGVSEDKKHLVSSEYSFVLMINAQSQQDNTNCLKTIDLKVETQDIEDFSITTYKVERRQIRNSILYLTPSSEVVNTLAPASDAIISVSVTPQYALMTHFTLTYEVSGTSVGTVGISKLAYNSLYGYYVNSSSTNTIENGIRVNLTEADKTGDGLFYFRLYISSSFASTSGVRLVVTYYNGDQVLATGSQTLSVNYLQDAVVRVNDATTYLLGKGETATVTVRVGIDQNLYNLYLQNNESNITLTTPTWVASGNYKIYTAQLIAGVDAKLVGGQTSGIFYVCASVSRELNGEQEIKVSRATVCLVDFSVDVDGISVSGSNGTREYNGRTYDVYHAYLNDSPELHFDYPILPEEYNYDRNDADQVEAVEKLMESREDFLTNNYFYDEDVGYYINYALDEDTGTYNPITLKQQLWYATDEDTSTAIYNENRDTITPNDYFNISEQTLSDGSTRLMISGKRAGTQLMRLRTVINYQGIELVDDYYFLIVVEVWSDEETPTQITTAEEFIDYATNSEEAGDYILMNDIVLSDYTPLSTDLIDSLDGNGFTIHINSFRQNTESSTLRLALFDTVTSNTTLRNVRVNIYNGGQIAVNIRQFTDIQIAGFAITNEGVIYNCEVVSYYDENYQISRNTGNSGLVVKYTRGANTDYIALSYSSNVNSVVSGFVIENNSSIMNSRVGGESVMHVVDIEGVNYLQSQSLGVFYLEGQGEVSGFVNQNAGYISASFVKNAQIDNIMEYDGSITAGFVVRNSLSIQSSYVEGLEGEPEEDSFGNVVHSVYKNGTNISALGVISGFVYENSSLVKNSYSNIAIENSRTKGAMVAGFVYRNNQNATISLCYAACEIALQDVNQMQFSGVDDFGNSLNNGTISLSYFYNKSRVDETIQTKVSTSAISISEVDEKDSFYGFSFASADGAYDGIWVMTDDGITLVSANQIAVSNRYATTTGNVTSIFYSRNIRNADTLEYVDLSYGGENNPIIIRNAEDFAKATGNATLTGSEISAYKEYYTDTEVTGRYRLVNNIQMTEIAQDAEDEGTIKLTTSKKVFRGLLDGNGFTISDISLGSSESVENYGLFARLQNAVIMNLDLTVESVHNTQANVVGVLAGTALDSRILSITLSPSENDEEGASIAVQGHNIVGGVVGMILGESYLSDITVNDVDVSSESYEEGKTVGANDSYIEGGKTLRSVVEDLDNGASLKDNVGRLSYAGAIAGFVDMYQNQDEGAVTFSTSREVSDFDVVTVRASDSVNVYAEVAGGLFGYVGKSTLVYDATVTINQNMELSTQGVNPSYIISKNLYAGGLIGENYGGLFAVSASYEENLQTEIETNENSYYNQNTSVERGQLSIFSYTQNDEDYSTRINNPLFIGGLVGYMGGGYIYVGYNKLNVIAHTPNSENPNEVVVGGIVGLSGVSQTRYSLGFTTQQMDVTVLYYEVYASGDTYSDSETGFSGGIIGALEKNGNSTGAVAMKNVMAMNYYSYLGTSLSADENSPAAGLTGYVSDKHYMLVGRIFDSNENEILNENTILPSGFYIINSTNDIAMNMRDGVVIGTSMGSYTVGGYKQIEMGSVTATLKEVGFASLAGRVSVSGDFTSALDTVILKAQHIGSDELQEMSSAYARMRNYFLSNGWDEKYWSHEQNTLLPIIQLLPKVNVQYWDVYNTEEVLAVMEDSSLTIVVRGRVTDDENDLSRTDIDLRKSGTQIDGRDIATTIENFRGRLVSYEYYMNTETGGRVTAPITEDGQIVGGDVGDMVGIILEQELFESISDGAQIEGVNFYLEPQEADGDSGFSIVSNEAEASIFRDINVVINKSMTLSSGVIHTDGNYKAIGLLTGLATSTSFYNISVEFKEDAGISFNASAGTAGEVYVGLLAGRIRQASAFSQMTVSEINISRFGVDSSDDAEIDIEFDFSTSSSSTYFYAGLFAGEISKTGMAKSTLGVNQLNGINLKISLGSGTSQIPNLYIGGFVGRLNGADEINFVERETDGADGTGLTIEQNGIIGNLYAGLAFGESRSTINFSFDDAPNAWILGKLVQNGGYAENANIGGLVGRASGIVNIDGLRMKFDVAGAGLFDYETDSDGVSNYEKYVNELATNQFEYSASESAFCLGGGIDNSVGAVVGYSNGGSLSMAGNCDIGGNLVVDTYNSESTGSSETTKTIYTSISALAGKVVDSSVTIGGVISNSTNIYVNGIGTSGAKTSNAYLGGVVGDIDVTTGTELSFEVGSAGGSYNYTGSIISSNAHSIYGGAFGRISAEISNTININSFVFGGTFRILASDSAKVTAGGVVGEFSWTSGADGAVPELTSATISNSLAYGDVFVIYPEYVGGTYQNVQLDNYVFGGIVGSAQSGLNIENCFSLLTNFNRTNETSNELSDVGAIVGANADSVNYSGNKYSSIVTMTFQNEGSSPQESGEIPNQDCGYGVGNFSGYTSLLYSTSDVTSLYADDILTLLGSSSLAEFINLNGAEIGQKLNPYMISEGNKDIQIDSENEDGSKVVSGSTNGISWVAITDDGLVGEANLEISNSIASDGTNFAIVGNGRTITRKSVDEDENIESSSVVYKGGIVDRMGVDYSSTGTNTPNFSLVSGLIVNLETTTNISNRLTNAYGGVVGYATGNSFIYGVGVKGEMYVGGDANIRVAGIVGDLRQGLVAQCYEDADISYGASTLGVVSGIANMNQLSSMVKATYSSGKITTYVDVNVYTFAYAVAGSDSSTTNAVRTLEDCYSITQVERNDVLSGDTTFSCGIYFAGNGTITSGNVNIGRQVINGTANADGATDLTDTESDLGYKSSEELSISYGNGERYSINSITLRPETEDSEDDTDAVTEIGEGRYETTNGGYNVWYFSRLTNYGYASHAFGYLKNSTTYVYTSTSEDSDGTDVDTGDTGSGEDAGVDDETETSVDEEKEYKIVPYAELVVVDVITDGDEIIGYQDRFDSWYLGVPSVGKFDQMVETVAVADYDMDYKFVLRYGFDLSDSVSFNAGTNIGAEDKDFVLDGGGNTINLSGVAMTSGVFGEVYGTIQNLRLINGNVESGATSVGLLANTVHGRLSNITAVGDISAVGSSGQTVGGIAGTLYKRGDATEYTGENLESLVNITNGSGAAIIGGVVGWFGGSINYAVNNGILMNNPSSSAGSLDQKITPMRFSSSMTPTLQETSESLKAITGGVVGMAVSGSTIENSYNGNSVLSNFGTDQTSQIDVVSGGVVGYATGDEGSGVKISNSYNASLVGSGTYESESYAYAGGIVGYAQNVTMTGCVNDGPVQALGEEDGDYYILVDDISGNLKDSAYRARPGYFAMKIYMYYNPGDNRFVNAFGLGFAENGEIGDTNVSSTNNVKNDGNVGEIEVISYMVFDRNMMLDNVFNDSDQGLYEAKFENKFSEDYIANFQRPNELESKRIDKDKIGEETGLYISGYDSYGFPARVYSIETINRRLSTYHPFYKFITTRTKPAGDRYNLLTGVNENSDQVKSWWGALIEDGYFIGSFDVSDTLDSLSTTSEIDYAGYHGDPRTNFTDYQYKMEASVDYYASSILGRWWGSENANLDGYDRVLQRLNNYAYILGEEVPGDTSMTTLSSATDDSLGSSISDFVNSKIAEIDSAFESGSAEELQVINVNGDAVGVAKTSSNLLTILSPYIAEIETIEFSVAGDGDEIDWNAITKDSFSFVGGTSPQFVEFAIIKDKDNNKVKLVHSSSDDENGPVLYFSEEVNQNISVEFSYQSKLLEFTIVQNNTILNGNSITIDLTKVDSETREYLLGENVKINNATIETEEVEYTSTSVISEGNDLIIGFEDLSGVTEEMLNGRQIAFDITETTEVSVNGNIAVWTGDGESASQEIAEITSGTDSWTYTFRNYTTNTLSQTLPSLSEFTQISDTEYQISYDDFFSGVAGLDGYRENPFVYILNEEGFSKLAVSWDGSDFKFDTDDVGVEITTNTDEDIISFRFISSNVERYFENISGKASTIYTKSDVYYTTSNEIPGSLGSSVSTIFGGLVTITDGVRSPSTDFTLQNVTGGWRVDFVGTNFEGITNSDGVNVHEIALEGVSFDNLGFRDIDVTFKYGITGTVNQSQIGSSDAVKFEISSGETIETIYYGGAFASNNFVFNLEGGDTLSYQKLTSNYGREEFDLLTSRSEDSSSIDLTVSSKILEEEDATNISYTVTQGTGTIMYYPDDGEISYVTTEKTILMSINDITYVYTYSYTIWENGFIELDFSATTPIGGVNEYYYVYLPKAISDGKNEIHYTDDNGAEQTATIEWEGAGPGYKEINKVVDGTLETDTFNERTGMPTEQELLDRYTLKVDVISIGFDEDEGQVWFEKNDYNQDELFIRGELFEDQETSQTMRLEIFIGNPESVKVRVDSIESGEAQIEYTVNGETTTVDHSEIILSSPGDYQVRWSATKSKNITCATADSSEVKTADIALLDADISMGDATQSTLEKNIVGRDYIVKFISSRDSIFEEISNTFVKNTIFTAQNAGGDGVNGLFAGSISTGVTIENVKLFGTIRNVAYNSSSINGEIYVDYETKTGTGTTSIENNASMIGLNNAQYGENGEYKGSNGNKFTVDFMSRDLDDNDKVVIVAGDSVKGNNGEKTYNVVSDDYKYGDLRPEVENATKKDREAKSGGNGSSAASGGVASGTEKNGSIIMSGQSAIGGYGGDGANGTFNNRSVALGGGRAGAAGSGTSTHTSTSQTQSAGNPGVGGFGRITGSDYNNFTIYTSGNSGTTGVNGSNGKNYFDKKCNDEGAGYFAFFGALLNNYCNIGQSGHTRNDYGSYEDSIKNYWSINSTSTSDVNYSSVGGVSGSGEGVSTHAKEIYLYGHIIVRQWFGPFYWSYHVVSNQQWAYVGWTSGETVNSAGQITFVGGGNVTT